MYGQSNDPMPIQINQTNKSTIKHPNFEFSNSSFYL
jgi:hypothetical protein